MIESLPLWIWVQIGAGVLGGNLMGEVSRRLNMKWLVNSLVGAVGGAIGGHAFIIYGRDFGLNLSRRPDLLDPLGWMSDVAGGGIGGAAFVLVLSVLVYPLRLLWRRRSA